MSERTRGMLRVGGLAAWVLVAALTAQRAEGQTWRNLTSSRQLWGSEPLSVTVEYGAGELEVHPLDPDGLMYQMDLRYEEERSAPVAEFDSAARRLRLGLEGRQRGHSGSREGSTARIGLTRAAPLDLALRFGAGEAEIDLSGLRLRRLTLETGASETAVNIESPNPMRAEEVELKAGAAELTVIGLGNLRADRILFQGGVGATTLDFRGPWEANASARVQMGMGSVVLRFPRSLGVQINRNALLTSFNADGFSRRDGVYYSDNWQSARHRITVDLDAALGSINVEWIDG